MPSCLLPSLAPLKQNVGNFITDRASSRVLAPPGGGSSIVFGDATSGAEPAQSPRSRREAPLSPAARAGNPAGLPGPAPGALSSVGTSNKADNNYARPAGQNVSGRGYMPCGLRGVWVDKPALLWSEGRWSMHLDCTHAPCICVAALVTCCGKSYHSCPCCFAPRIGWIFCD